MKNVFMFYVMLWEFPVRIFFKMKIISQGKIRTLLAKFKDIYLK